MKNEGSSKCNHELPAGLAYQYDPVLGGYWVSSALRTEFIPNRSPEERARFAWYVRLRLAEERAAANEKLYGEQ